MTVAKRSVHTLFVVLFAVQMLAFWNTCCHRGGQRFSDKHRFDSECQLFGIDTASRLFDLSIPKSLGVATMGQLWSRGEVGKAGACNKQIHFHETFWIGMASWNNTADLHRALQNIAGQQESYDSVHVVVFEDYSRDLLSLGDKTMHERNFHSRGMQVSFLSATSFNNMGAAFGKWAIFKYIRQRALLHEYVMLVDGDDVLADEFVLRDIRNLLRSRKPWFAWGRHNGKHAEQCADLKLKPEETFRSTKWSFCHPRVFQSHLLQHLGEQDFQRDDGSWLLKATDRPFIFGAMERAGAERIHFMGARPLYNYSFGANNGLKIMPAQVISGDKALVNQRPPAAQEPQRIYVIFCVNNRNSTKKMLTRLLGSTLESGQVMHIHVCNNNIARREELHRTAEELAPMQSPSRTVQIHSFAKNEGGFARFLLAKRLMHTEFVEYVIMVDDDQFVHPDTIARIYESREPQTYKTWYGKNWNADETSYWKPSSTVVWSTTTTLKAHEGVTSWQYGGTGLSIVDAAVFEIKELFELEKRYQFIEDLWLSYIVQVAGWKIGRLFVTFDPEEKSVRVGSDQWRHPEMKARKTELFSKLGFLKCSTHDPSAYS